MSQATVAILGHSPISGHGVNRSAAASGVKQSQQSQPTRPRAGVVEGRSVPLAPPATVNAAGSVGGRAATRANQALTLSDLVAVARKRANVIRNVALGVIAATLVILLVLPSSYTASAVVMLDPRKNNVAGMSSVLSELPTDPASVQNQIQILTSRDLAGIVIQRLNLEADPEFNTSLAPSPLNPVTWLGKSTAEGQYTRIIDTFLSHLSVDAIGLSTAMSVKFASRDPDKAARIANAIADAYMELQIDVNAAVSHRTTAWLAQRIRELARQVEAAEANVQRYKAENAINDTGDGTGSIVEQQLAAINTQLVQARADLAAKQANYDHITALMKSGNAADVSQVVSSPLIVQLRTQQSEAIRDESQLDTRYGPKHPKRIAAESQRRDLEAKIDQEVTRIAGSVANDVAVARAQVKSLETSLARAEAQDNDQNLARVQLKALESDAASTRTMYEAFVTRLRETQGQDAVQVSDARVISHASVPTSPSSPKRTIIFGASIPAGLLLGLLCALMLEKLEPAGAAREMSRRPLLPVLAEAPHATLPRAADLVIDMPAAPFARAMWALARRLATGPRVIAVTSFDPADGQSNVAVGLSRALAKGGRRVVLVDANPPMLAWTLNAAPARADAIQVLGGAAPLASAVARDPRSGVLLLSAAATAWTTPRMGSLLDHLRRSADIVIIDAPRMNAAELGFVAPHAEAYVVVARKGSRNVPALARAMSQSGFQNAGLVLTA